MNFKFFLLFTLLIFNQLLAGDQYGEEPPLSPVTSGGAMRTSEDGAHTSVCSSTAEGPEDVFDEGVVPPDSAYFSPRKPRAHPLWRSRSEGSPPKTIPEPELDALKILLTTAIDPRIVFNGLAPLQQKAILNAYGTLQVAVSNHLYWESILRNKECA